MESKVHTLLEGQAYAWIEQQSSVMLKVVSRYGDPVEMTWDGARQLGRLLLTLAEQGEASDQIVAEDRPPLANDGAEV